MTEQSQGAVTDKDKRMYCMLTHLTALCAFVGIPFGNVLGPLVIWMIKKNEIPEVDVHFKKAMNFQLSMSIYILVAAMLCFVFIGFLLLFPLIIANIILTIIASVKANNNEDYDYPLTIQFLK